jgi:hypothetical protein
MILRRVLINVFTGTLVTILLLQTYVFSESKSSIVIKSWVYYKRTFVNSTLVILIDTIGYKAKDDPFISYSPKG